VVGIREFDVHYVFFASFIASMTDTNLVRRDVSVQGAQKKSMGA